MTDKVVSLRPEQELGEFFDNLWEQQEGFVYSPLKSLDETPKFETYFFKWPKQKDELIQHILINTESYEVYYGPALYNLPTVPIQENILGSFVYWAEFDGNAPTSFHEIPEPTFRVRSSNDRHEHIYWKLNSFESNYNKIEKINRAVAYQLQADTSGWDSTQVLRPPLTKNHKRDRIVRTVSINNSVYTSEDFQGIQVPKEFVKSDIKVESAPDLLTVIAKYKWEPEVFDFFRERTKEKGTRSSSMMRLAYHCTEMSMSNEEAFAILYNADERWGKYKNRHNRAQCLVSIINRAREKYPVAKEESSVVESKLKFVNWQQLTDLEIKIEWLIPGILQKQGLMLVTGPPDVGKTQFNLQMLIHLAIGKPWLGWQITHPHKVCFFSMEMSLVELKLIVDQMAKGINEEDRLLLSDNFQFIPVGHGISMDTVEDQQMIESYIQAEKPDIITFDSLSVSTKGKIDDEITAKSVIGFAGKLRIDYEVSVVYIHHNRKGQVNNKKPKGLDDVYGHRILTSQPTTILGLWRDEGSDEIEVNFLKVRLAKAPKKMLITRSDNISFVSTNPDSLMKLGEETRSDRDDKSESSSKERPFEL